MSVSTGFTIKKTCAHAPHKEIRSVSLYFKIPLFTFFIFYLTLFVLSGCYLIRVNEGEKTFPPDDFIVVTVNDKDNFSSLASTYYNDPHKGWIIKEFNEINTLYPGLQIVIPLNNYKKGGLTASGYQTVPVIAYNNFSETKSHKTTVTRDSFEKQMKLLKDKGFHVISVDALIDFINNKDQIPKKSVVITIDNGWNSFYDIAYPVLRKYNYPATLFLYTGLVEMSPLALTWDKIKIMADDNIAIQCNTDSFRDLTQIDEKETFNQYFSEIKNELTRCRQKIKERINKHVLYLAYPYGKTNKLVTSLLKKEGFRAAFSVNRAGNPFFINRYLINRSMIYGDFDLDTFERNLHTFKDISMK